MPSYLTENILGRCELVLVRYVGFRRNVNRSYNGYASVTQEKDDFNVLPEHSRRLWRLTAGHEVLSEPTVAPEQLSHFMITSTSHALTSIRNFALFFG